LKRVARRGKRAEPSPAIRSPHFPSGNIRIISDAKHAEVPGQGLRNVTVIGTPRPASIAIVLARR